MYKLSDLIGKEAITLADAKKQGVIFNAHFDQALRQCRYFSIIDNEEELGWVEFKNVLSLQNDAVIIRCCDDICDAPEGATVPSPINLKVFNQDGVMMGYVRDVEMDGGRIIKFITDTMQIEPLCLLSISEEILVFNDSGKPIKLKKRAEAKQKPPTQATETSRQISSDTAPVAAQGVAQGVVSQGVVSQGVASQGVVSPADIKKIPFDKTVVNRSPQQQPLSKYSFLLGKRLQRTIYDAKGGLIAHENDLITDLIINKAKEQGKLVVLALHSL